MKDATLGQAGKILEIFGNTPKDQVQEILASGLLADLRDGNITGVNREDFRRILGLSSLLLLELISTVIVPARTAKFITCDHFIVDTSKKAKVKISYLGDNFKKNFLGKVEEAIARTTLRYHKLRKSSVDRPIIAELGGSEKAETTLSEMFTLMEMQSNGESGVLLTNDYANIFYIRDINSVLWAVGCSWLGGSWDVGAGSIDYPGGWYDGRQVFSRNFSESQS